MLNIKKGAVTAMLIGSLFFHGCQSNVGNNTGREKTPEKPPISTTLTYPTHSSTTSFSYPQSPAASPVALPQSPKPYSVGGYQVKEPEKPKTPAKNQTPTQEKSIQKYTIVPYSQTSEKDQGRYAPAYTGVRTDDYGSVEMTCVIYTRGNETIESISRILANEYGLNKTDIKKRLDKVNRAAKKDKHTIKLYGIEDTNKYLFVPLDVSGGETLSHIGSAKLCSVTPLNKSVKK